MAGTMSEAQFNESALYSGVMFALRVDFSADSSDGTVPTKTFTMPHASFLADVDFVSEDTLTATIEVQTTYGVKVHPDDTISLTQNSRYILQDRPSVIGGFKLAITTSGASDSGKSGYVVLNFASNKLR